MASFEDSGKCKGYAWVTFNDISSATTAMRGWAEVSSSEHSPESHQSRKRRVWLNRMQGRALRLEYAEDSGTRYNKRFGKKSQLSIQAADVGDSISNATQTLERPTANGRQHRSKGPGHEPSVPHSSSRNSPKSTRFEVGGNGERNSGFAVVGHGKKTMFD